MPGEIIREKCGTPAYVAPEILLNNGYDGFGIDIWSAGVVLFAMIYGSMPFKASNMTNLHKQILSGSFKLKQSASKEVRDLLRKMLEIDPKKRFTIPQILSHKWFENYDDNILLFTNKEKVSIMAEFTSHKSNRNKMQNSVPESKSGSDWFIEQNIDSSQSELTRNISSKSIILAPFNSSQNEDSESHETITEVIIPNNPIKLCAKVKDIDIQYERNNNCNVDNGVYNSYEESDSISELDPLDNSEDIYSNEENNEVEINNNGINMTKMLLDSLNHKKPDIGTITNNYR